MADIKTTLHREDAPQDNVYPNIVADNIPAQCIDHTKVNDTIPSLSSAPTSSDAGKVVAVNSSGSGYELKDVDGAVTSVNGETGDVVISKNDLGLAVVALTGSYDDLTDKPTTVTSVNGETGVVVISKYDLGLSAVALYAPNYDSSDAGKCLKVTNDGAGLEWASDNTGGGSGGTVTSVNGETGDVVISKYDLGLSAVALNAPNYNSADAGKCLKVTDDGLSLVWGSVGTGGAVTSVNGETGDVVISKFDLGLASVAISGSYNDLTDKPDISSSGVTSVNGETGEVVISKFDLGLASVAISGSYNDLTDKPDISSGGVTSVNGETGDVVISKYDLGLSAVALYAPNYSSADAGKCLKVADDGLSLVWASDNTGDGGGTVTPVNGQTSYAAISKNSLGLGSLLNERQFVQGSTPYSGMDFNATQNMDTGSYCFLGTSDLPCYNGPSSSANTNSDCMWEVLVFKYNDENDYVTQIAISLRSVEMFIRNKNKTAWTEWKQII